MDEIEIEAVVVIEVEQSGTRAHDLRHEVAADRPCFVAEMQTDLSGVVAEPNGIIDDGRRIAPLWNGTVAAQKGQRCKQTHDDRAQPTHCCLFEPLMANGWHQPVGLFLLLHLTQCFSRGFIIGPTAQCRAKRIGGGGGIAQFRKALP